MHAPSQPLSFKTQVDNYFWALLSAAFLAAAATSLVLSGMLSDAGIQETQDLWFNGDTSRVFINLTQRWSDHYRTSVHPLAALLLTTPTVALTKLGCSPEVAARLVVACGAGLLAATFFYLCRLLTGRLLDASIYTLLLISTSSFLFFATAFELYGWGAFSILAALATATIAGRHKDAGLVVGSALSLSFTVTNWMAGLAVAAATQPPRRALLYSALAFALVAALSALQVNIYRSSGRFLNFREEASYARLDISKKLSAAPREFFADPIVFPGVQKTTADDGDGILIPALTDDTDGRIYMTALLIWLLIAGIGAYRVCTTPITAHRAQPVAALAAALICGQLLLHLIYGDGFFMYSLHFAPLLLLVASCASQTRWRWHCLAGAVLLTGLAAWNNLGGLEQSAQFLPRPPRS